MDSCSKQKSQLKSEVAEEKSMISKLKKELVVSQSRLAENQRTVEWYKRDSTTKEKTINEMRNSIRSYEIKIEGHFEEVSKLQAKIEIMEDEKSHLHEETLLAKRHVHETEAELKLSCEENDRINMEMQSLHKRMSDVQSTYNACESEKHDLQQQVSITIIAKPFFNEGST